MKLTAQRIAEVVRAAAKASLDQIVARYDDGRDGDGYPREILCGDDYAALLNAIANNAAQVLIMELEASGETNEPLTDLRAEMTRVATMLERIP